MAGKDRPPSMNPVAAKRRRNVPLEHGHHVVDEVGRSVVEGDHDLAPPGMRPAADCSGERLTQAHGRGAKSSRHLIIEVRHRQVDLQPQPAPTGGR